MQVQILINNDVFNVLVLLLLETLGMLMFYELVFAFSISMKFVLTRSHTNTHAHTYTHTHTRTRHIHNRETDKHTHRQTIKPSAVVHMLYATSSQII